MHAKTPASARISRLVTNFLVRTLERESVMEATFWGGIDTHVPLVDRVKVAPIHVTDWPPSALCQAKGNPATAAHRRAMQNEV